MPTPKNRIMFVRPHFNDEETPRIEALPTEILDMIIGKLSYHELYVIKRVSRRFSDVAESFINRKYCRKYDPGEGKDKIEEYVYVLHPAIEDIFVNQHGDIGFDFFPVDKEHGEDEGDVLERFRRLKDSPIAGHNAFVVDPIPVETFLKLPFEEQEATLPLLFHEGYDIKRNLTVLELAEEVIFKNFDMQEFGMWLPPGISPTHHTFSKFTEGQKKKPGQTTIYYGVRGMRVDMDLKVPSESWRKKFLPHPQTTWFVNRMMEK